MQILQIRYPIALNGSDGKEEQGMLSREEIYNIPSVPLLKTETLATFISHHPTSFNCSCTTKISISTPFILPISAAAVVSNRPFFKRLTSIYTTYSKWLPDWSRNSPSLLRTASAWALSKQQTQQPQRKANTMLFQAHWVWHQLPLRERLLSSPVPVSLTLFPLLSFPSAYLSGNVLSSTELS